MSSSSRNKNQNLSVGNCQVHKENSLPVSPSIRVTKQWHLQCLGCSWGHSNYWGRGWFEGHTSCCFPLTVDGKFQGACLSPVGEKLSVEWAPVNSVPPWVARPKLPVKLIKQEQWLIPVNSCQISGLCLVDGSLGSLTVYFNQTDNSWGIRTMSIFYRLSQAKYSLKLVHLLVPRSFASRIHLFYTQNTERGGLGGRCNLRSQQWILGGIIYRTCPRTQSSSPLWLWP